MNKNQRKIKKAEKAARAFVDVFLPYSETPKANDQTEQELARLWDELDAKIDDFLA